MQSLTLLLALAASAASAILPREPAGLPFNVLSFDVESVNGNGGTDFSMSVELGDVVTQCSTKTLSQGYGELCASGTYAPAITGFDSIKCAAPAFSWSLGPFKLFTQPERNGFLLSINHTVADGGIETGCHFIDEASFYCSTDGVNPANDAEHYSGPSNFTVPGRASPNACTFA